jgi:phosphoribosylanthranilate isomerase
MSRPIWIKICGITLPSDVEMIAAAGANAIGLNFIARSKRRVDIAVARELAKLARRKVECVGVVADLDEPSIRDLVDVVGLDRVQLHGNEPNELLLRLGSVAYKALGVQTAADVRRAHQISGSELLVDAMAGGQVGGTGTTFDWSLVEELCRQRDVIVAGGLHPGNVGEAVARLRPFGIDVASGVELPAHPGVKDEALVRSFIATIRRAESQ